MPTAGRLAGAVVFAVLGYLVAAACQATMPEERPGRLILPVAIGLYVLMGWSVVGRNAGRGWNATMALGLRASAQAVLLGVVFFALYEMFRRSIRRFYDDPGEAAIATLELFLRYGEQILVAPVLVTAILGALIGGLFVEAAAQRWR